MSQNYQSLAKLINFLEFLTFSVRIFYFLRVSAWYVFFLWCFWGINEDEDFIFHHCNLTLQFITDFCAFNFSNFLLILNKFWCILLNASCDAQFIGHYLAQGQFPNFYFPGCICVLNGSFVSKFFHQLWFLGRGYRKGAVSNLFQNYFITILIQFIITVYIGFWLSFDFMVMSSYFGIKVSNVFMAMANSICQSLTFT